MKDIEKVSSKADLRNCMKEREENKEDPWKMNLLKVKWHSPSSSCCC